MKAIISRQNPDGSYAEVGTTNRMVIGHMKSERGILRFARKYAGSIGFRVEFFTTKNFYGEPYKVVRESL